jgi:hypothetical protein
MKDKNITFTWNVKMWNREYFKHIDISIYKSQSDILLVETYNYESIYY